MLELRYYQREAVDGLYSYWADKPGSPLIVLPTGGGKSLVLATICKELVENYPDMRILNVTHVRELIIGNYRELINIWPFAPAGIFSAGIGRRDAHAQIIFGGVQTIANKVGQIGHVDLVIVDEAHLMPRNSETQYGQLLAGLRTINPDLKLVGLTATPFRLGEGSLHEGDDALFDDICYEMPVARMIEEGYLCRPISKGMMTHYDMTGVAKLGGDYKQNALQAAVDQIDINGAVVDEIEKYSKDRRAWLLFCSGVEHAYHMRDEIRSRGYTCETVSGETPTAERDRILADFKGGRIRAVTNNSVMTTGTNIPAIDLVAFCRPTLSPGLYLQMAGRGLRTHPGKENCLFLDFAGVVRKHGPIDAVVPPSMRKGDGEAPVKLCPEETEDAKGRFGCGSLVHASAHTCPDCGYEFPIDDSPKISAQAEDTPIMSTEKPWSTVTSRRFWHHPGKAGKPDTVKIAYTLGLGRIQNEWACPGHTGFPKTKADRYWRLHGGALPFPKNWEEWLTRQDELAPTAEIQLDYSKDGKWPEIVAHRVAANDNEPAPAPP
jgi:DNA repair protein RadD